MSKKIEKPNLEIEKFQPVFVLLTIKQFSEKHEAFSYSSIRGLIFKEDKNGLAKSGAILRVGRRVLIDEAKFFAWVGSQNKGGA